jgi:hypothetical protein
MYYSKQIIENLSSVVINKKGDILVGYMHSGYAVNIYKLINGNYELFQSIQNNDNNPYCPDLTISKDGTLIVLKNYSYVNQSEIIYVYQLRNGKYVLIANHFANHYLTNCECKMRVSDDNKIIAFNEYIVNKGYVFLITDNGKEVLKSRNRKEIDSFGDDLIISEDNKNIFISDVENNEVYWFSKEDNKYKRKQKIKMKKADCSFGQSLAFDGKHLFISDSEANIVYIYFKRRNELTLINTIKNPFNGKHNSRFGNQIAINGFGDKLLITAPNQKVGNFYFYLKEDDDWLIEQRIKTNQKPHPLYGDKVNINFNGKTVVYSYYTYGKGLTDYETHIPMTEIFNWQ